MPKANTFSDDAILTALQTYQTVAAAANAVGVAKEPFTAECSTTISGRDWQPTAPKG